MAIRDILILAFAFLLASCSTQYNNVEDLPPVEVQVAFTGFDINVLPMSRADEAPATMPDDLNRIALSVFAEGRAEAVATYTQKRETLGEGETFGSLYLRLPVGTYTFVAVLHKVEDTNLAPAAITSPTLATLPDNKIHDTYCCVHTQAISANSAVTLNLGSRINARFQLETLDEVPEGVTSIAVYVNTGVSTTAPDQPTINPSTGLATADWKYVKNLIATPGQKFDRTFSILLNEDSKSVSVRLTPQPTSATYPSRTITEVPFQRNQHTHATGYLFSLSPSFTFTFSNIPWTQEDVSF